MEKKEELESRLNDLMVKYLNNAQHLLPSLTKLGNIRQEIEAVLKGLKDLGYPQTDIDKIANQLGINIEKVKQVLKG